MKKLIIILSVLIMIVWMISWIMAHQGIDISVHEWAQIGLEGW